MKQSDTTKAIRRVSAAIRLTINADALELLKKAHDALFRASKAERKANPLKKYRRVKTPKGKLFDECKKLWGQAVKARAGYKSELSGKPGPFNSHHIEGKINWWLRFSLENGVCITRGEHNNGAHSTQVSIAAACKERIWAVKPLRHREQVELLKNRSGKPDLGMIKIRLQIAIKQHGENPCH